MALSWTQDRIGPMCRYAEDCAIVMQAIARLDGRDMSVSDIPFNWDGRLDIRKLRVGYIKESFDEIANAEVKANAQKLLDTLRSLGVSRFVEMKIPTSQGATSSLGVESFVYFDEMRRAGKLAGSRMGNANRPTARLVPAVEYLQQQRLRMMMMTELAAATKDVDVYLVASSGGGGGGGRGRGADPPDPAAGRAGDPVAAARGADPARGGGAGRGGARGGRGGGGAPAGPAQRHSTMANLACYPAINVPTGFVAAGTPTNVTFFARPFGEMELLALAKAYQDAARHHLVKPTKMDQ
jgi:Asp-tRNA(Asn)/Glu-tRNA(Gln) amidotransferase A subunit family amidase